MNDRARYAMAYAGAGLATLALWTVILAAGAGLGYLVVLAVRSLW